MESFQIPLDQYGCNRHFGAEILWQVGVPGSWWVKMKKMKKMKNMKKMKKINMKMKMSSGKSYPVMKFIW